MSRRRWVPARFAATALSLLLGCGSIEPVAGTGAPTGRGADHPGAARCEAPPEQACHGDETFGRCASDTLCDGGPHGRCGRWDVQAPGGHISICGCSYACQTDADCSRGERCVCGGGMDPRCVPAGSP